jgi:hypothetical protein
MLDVLRRLSFERISITMEVYIRSVCIQREVYILFSKYTSGTEMIVLGILLCMISSAYLQNS